MIVCFLLTSFIFTVFGHNEINSTSNDESNTTDHIVLQIPLIQIPAQETVYVCQQFEINDTRPYHVTKFEPILNNTNLVHHMLVFGCDFKIDEKGPHQCNNMDYKCRTWLVKWDIGMPDILTMPKHTGVRIGKESFKYLLLQVHMNNKGAKDNIVDSSGMKLHITDNLREHDIGNVQIGQNNIDINGGRSDVLITGKCNSRCTSLMLPRPIYITDIYLHMHKLGKSASLDIIRDREVRETFATETNYNYTRPMWHTLDPPQVVYPGQEIMMKCWYDSASTGRARNVTTNFGQGTEAEMCYAFIRYYPRVLGFDQCLQSGEDNLSGC
ncbi:hypothetical protein ACF0H5_019200 [Mactra antiquata]